MRAATDKWAMKRLPPTAERLIAGLGLCLAFVFMASIFAPDLSQAGDNQSTEPTSAAEQSTDPHEDLLSLGTIEDDNYRVRIYTGERGPLYSVYSASDGQELGVLLSADEVAAWFPDLPIPQMDFAGQSPILLAEPDVPTDSD